MSEYTTCPYCGGEYKRLSVHLLYCKEKPDEEEGEETISYPDDIEYTSSVLSPVFNVDLEPIPFDAELTEPTPDLEPTETQTEPCPYLVVIAGSGCSSCKGTTCMASRDKKISNQDFCKYEWLDCILYDESAKAGVRASCPYISLTVPEGRYSCTGMWCHARDKAVKVDKRCRNWGVCGPFLEAKSDGKPYYRKQVK